MAEQSKAEIIRDSTLEPMARASSNDKPYSAPQIGNTLNDSTIPVLNKTASQWSLDANTSRPRTGNAQQVQIGEVDAPPPPPGLPVPVSVLNSIPLSQFSPFVAPPPAWLVRSLEELDTQYSDDDFQSMMRYTAVNMDTGLPMSMPPQGLPTPANVKFMYLPRIKCLDCPGKLYTPGPGMTTDNFEVHLKNRGHRERVNARVSREARSGY